MTDRLIHAEISIKELEVISESIKTLHASGKINNEQRRLFMHAIMAGDSKGNLWTIGTQTGKWYKQVGDKWLEDQPPETLLLVVPEKDFMAAKMQMNDLKLELDIKAYRAIRCLKCGSEYKVGDIFCYKCGAKIAKVQQQTLPTRQAKKCPGCGQVITDSPNFCSKCGRKLN